MGVMAMAISMMFYLGKEKVMPIEKELLAIINSYHGWDYYESEKYGRIGMIKIWTDVEIKKGIINKDTTRTEQEAIT
jgi:hypothetical protein